MFDVESGMSQAMAELGIDQNSLDEGSDLEIETESMEAEGEINEDKVETEPTSNEDESSDPETLEDVEKGEDEVQASDDQEKTVKESQEVETLKQNFEAEKKAFHEEMLKKETEFQQEHHEKLKERDDLDAFLGHIADKDPDLFDMFKVAYQDHRKEYVMLDKFRQETQSLRQELNSFKEKATDQATLTKLDAELNQVKSGLGKDAEALGVKIDWDKVTEKWASMPGSDIEFIAHGLYGANIAKAAASKAKVEAVTRKVSSRPAVTTAGNVQKSASSNEPNFNGMNAESAVSYFARKLTAKA
jgi:hypothetical protein